MANVFKKVEVTNINKDDHIIALMGPTGVGKSTFIQVAANQPLETVGHDLKSHTQDLRAVRGHHPFDPSRSIVFLDTPGFEDTERSDGEILKQISKWLKKTYNQDLKLAGIIYLHRISDRRMRGAQLKNLRMFGQIVGSDALSNVVLATTMWSTEQHKYNLEVQREKELKSDYWKPMLDNKAQVARFWKTHVSAWEICNQVLQVKVEHPALLIQEELVDLKRALGQTAAGLQLFTMLQELLKQQQETLRKIRQEAEAQGDPALSRALNDEYEETQGKVNQTYEQMKEMKVPFGKRILAFFSIRRTHAAPVNIVAKP